MDISIRAIANMNPELNIGNRLQMFKNAGLDKSAAKGINAGSDVNDTGSGNAFIKVLQQKMAMLPEGVSMTDPTRNWNPEYFAGKVALQLNRNISQFIEESNKFSQKEIVA